MIEVGAGPGSLTRSLLELSAKRVIAVEKDKRFLPALEFLKESSQGRLEVVHGDMLELDEAELLGRFDTDRSEWQCPLPPVRLLGNLPFGIATQLYLKWLRQIPRRQGLFAYGRVPMVLMFQKEVADRIVSPPGYKVYGRLSVMTSYASLARSCFTIGGKAFVPPPKVDAGVVHIQPTLAAPSNPTDYDRLEHVLQCVFQQRRKQLRNSLSSLVVDVPSLLHACALDGTIRPEALPIEGWLRIVQNYQRYL